MNYEKIEVDGLAIENDGFKLLAFSS